MPAKEKLELVNRMVRDVLNRRDPDAADSIFSGDYVNHGGLIIDLVNGPESIKMSVELFRAAFPEFWVTIDDQSADADSDGVIASWTAHGKNPTLGPTTAKSNSVSGRFRCLFSEGRITESWMTWDQARLSENVRRACDATGIKLDK